MFVISLSFILFLNMLRPCSFKDLPYFSYSVFQVYIDALKNHKKILDASIFVFLKELLNWNQNILLVVQQ